MYKPCDSLLAEETKNDDGIFIHFEDPKVAISLTNLNKELTCAKIANHCPELSFKKIAFYFFLATISIAPFIGIILVLYFFHVEIAFFCASFAYFGQVT